MNDIGLRIKELRKALGYTQKQMAFTLGINHAHVSKIEKGKGSASNLLLNHICSELLVSKTWLTAGEGSMFLQAEEIIKNNIIHFGEQTFIEALQKILDEQGLMVPIGSLAYQSVSKDPELCNMINFLVDLWATEDEKLKAWTQIQFARSFPPDIIEEVQNKKKETKGGDIFSRNQQNYLSK